LPGRCAACPNLLHTDARRMASFFFPCADL
jgi:hypothetical protein